MQQTGYQWRVSSASLSLYSSSNSGLVQCLISSELVIRSIVLKMLWLYIIFESFFLEIVEVSPRPVAMSLGSFTSWLCNLTVGMSFPPLNGLIGAFVFLPFAVACTLVFFITLFFVPETRGRDSSELAPMMAKGFKSKIK